MSVAETAVATALIVVAPGPALAVSISSAVEGGRRAGLLAIAGLSAGIVLHAAAAAAGLAILLASDPRVGRAMQTAGASFLVVVGVRMVARALRPGRPAHARASTSGRTAYLARGLLTNVLNPWILGFYLTLLPSLSEGGSGPPVVAAAIVAGIHVAQLAVWHGLVVATVSAAAAIYERRGRAVRLAAGAALVATGCWFVLR